jgi:hypothetical protein
VGEDIFAELQVRGPASCRLLAGKGKPGVGRDDRHRHPEHGPDEERMIAEKLAVEPASGGPVTVTLMTR